VRAVRVPLILAALAAAVVCVLPAPARAATTCRAGSYPGSGYFTSLQVTHTSCAAGRKLEVAYYRCRLRHGPRGRCPGGVLGYSCVERRVSIPTEVDARVTCHRGTRRIVHTYQQNT
jgi:hypothetical protein